MASIKEREECGGRIAAEIQQWNMCKIHFHKVILTQRSVLKKKNYYSPFGLWVHDPMAYAVKLQFKILNKQYFRTGFWLLGLICED